MVAKADLEWWPCNALTAVRTAGRGTQWPDVKLRSTVLEQVRLLRCLLCQAGSAARRFVLPTAPAKEDGKQKIGEAHPPIPHSISQSENPEKDIKEAH